MPKSIYKYPLTAGLVMPKGAEILSVQTQNNQPQIWALVDPHAPTEIRRFDIIGTGWEIEDDYKGLYVATYQVNGGGLVFHFFEV